MNNPELVASLLKQGGRVLIVGGEMKDLPRAYHEHPQIIVWDDNQQGNLQKEIPTNVKVIIYNRWVSHATAGRLSKAAKDLHAIKFPMLRSREIKELMAEVISAEPAEVTPEQLEQIVETTTSTEVGETTVAEPTTLKEFVAKFINYSQDFTPKGVMATEGRRLYEVAKKEKFKTTVLSMQQATRLFVNDMMRSRNLPVIIKSKKSTKVKSTVSGVDDFAELDRLLTDAITAMKLIQEHLPKVRQETEKLRGMKAKVLSLFD